MIKTLEDIQKGETCRIAKFQDRATQMHLMRFGLTSGQLIKCLAKTGPIIIGKNKQCLAIGKKLARKIIVKPVQAA